MANRVTITLHDADADKASRLLDAMVQHNIIGSYTVGDMLFGDVVDSILSDAGILDSAPANKPSKARTVKAEQPLWQQAGAKADPGVPYPGATVYLAKSGKSLVADDDQHKGLRWMATPHKAEPGMDTILIQPWAWRCKVRHVAKGVEGYLLNSKRGMILDGLNKGILRTT